MTIHVRTWRRERWQIDALNATVNAVLVLALLFFSSPVVAGVWGVGVFENDDAVEWALQCTQSPDVSPVADAIDKVLLGTYIEAPEAAVALAAIEVVAAAVGSPSAELPDNLRVWVAHQPRDALAQLKPLAHKALVRVLDLETSELAQLMAEGHDKEWRDELHGVIARLDRI